jgi:transposase
MNIIHWIGIDDHADKLTVADLVDGDEPIHEFEVVPDEKGNRKLLGYLKGLSGEVRVVYEAGPCGFELYRRLRKAGIRCDVAAPSLTPFKPGDRVKTNRRDARKLARFHRSGELTLIAVPDEKREAVRDVVRGREAVLKRVVALRNQITKLLLRYGLRYRDGKAWTKRFWTWLAGLEVKNEDSRFVLDELISALNSALDQLGRFDDRIEAASKGEQYAPYVAALRTLRGIDTLSAMTILVELGDLRRFARAPQLMGALGVVPGENSTGDTHTRLPITKTGNAHIRRVLIEAAWNYTSRSTEGRVLKARRKGQPQVVVEIARKCDLRLNRKYRRMTSRGKRSTLAVVAIARELAGFIWAVGQIAHP